MSTNELFLIGHRHKGRIGHICHGANVHLLNADGEIVGYLTPEAADMMVEAGLLGTVTV